jgi:hypothetical protein
MTCLLLLFLVGFAHSSSDASADAPTVVSIAITSDGTKAIAMGQTARVRASWTYATPTDASGEDALVAFPFVNGSQWGAPLTLSAAGLAAAGRSNGNRILLLPIPHAGTASLALVVLRHALQGVTVGVELASVPLASRLASSNALSVPVLHRTIVRLGGGGGGGGSPAVQVGIQWEPILAAGGGLPGSQGGGWNMHEAVPLVGKYSAFDANVLKQHAIWLAESGVEWLNVDWTNNLWNQPNFSKTLANCPGDVINGTTFALEGFKQLRLEGIPCPKIALMMGMSNGAIAPVPALNAQLQWVRENYLEPHSPSSFLTIDELPVLVRAPRPSIPRFFIYGTIVTRQPRGPACTVLPGVLCHDFDTSLTSAADDVRWWKHSCQAPSDGAAQCFWLCAAVDLRFPGLTAAIPAEGLVVLDGRQIPADGGDAERQRRVHHGVVRLLQDGHEARLARRPGLQHLAQGRRDFSALDGHGLPASAGIHNDPPVERVHRESQPVHR